ncbi:hypothetical protein [Haloferax prahovense]|uniref:hypothetical protein n=1 Tax=Haloferax prahovense TaxID=381852 RepID=UPI0012696B1E|nr:hypothetical protein [Haloferax prahovense]
MTTTNPLEQRQFVGLLIGLLALGILLLIGSLPGSPLRSGNLELVVIFSLPLLIALITYLRFAPSAIWWEIVLLGIWGIFGLAVAAFIGFLLTMDATGGYPGARIELLQDITRFVAMTVGVGLPYGLAGMFREEKPRIAVLSVLLAPIALIILVSVTSSLL